MTKSGRISEIDVLRGISILGVLVLHSGFGGRFTGETMAVQAVLARLFDWAVLAFFFSSGFLHDRTVPFTEALKKKTESLIVPFFLYYLAYNLCLFGMSAAGLCPANAFAINFKSIGSALLFSPAFQLYFLPYLFLVSVGVCGMEKLNPRRCSWGYFSILILVTMFYLVTGYPRQSHGADYQNLPMYLAMFVAGIIIRPFFNDTFIQPWIVGATLVLALSLLVFFRLFEASLLVPPLLVALTGGMTALRESKLLLSMGRMSGSIYLWHTPLLLPFLTRILAGCGVPSLFNLCGSIVLALAICMVLRLGLDSVFLRMTKKTAPKYITL